MTAVRHSFEKLFKLKCEIHINLTEVAGEGGPHLAPQKFLLSQKFRHLMRCKKYVEKIFFLA